MSFLKLCLDRWPESQDAWHTFCLLDRRLVHFKGIKLLIKIHIHVFSISLSWYNISHLHRLLMRRHNRQDGIISKISFLQWILLGVFSPSLSTFVSWGLILIKTSRLFFFLLYDSYIKSVLEIFSVRSSFVFAALLASNDLFSLSTEFIKLRRLSNSILPLKLLYLVANETKGFWGNIYVWGKTRLKNWIGLFWIEVNRPMFL